MANLHELDFSNIPTRKWADGRELDISAEGVIPMRIRRFLSKEPFNLTQGFRLLDIGCGTGTSVNYMRSNNIEAYGIDIDQDSVMPYDNEFFFQEDARETHFPDSFFDVVTESWMFAQLGLEEKEEMIGDILVEMNRVLKPGGYLISHPLGGGTYPSQEEIDTSGFATVTFPQTYWHNQLPWFYALQSVR